VNGDQADTFGAWARRQRERIGLSQGQIAEKTGFDRSYVSRVESDQVSPSADFAVAFAESTNLDVREVLTYAGYRVSVDSQLEGMLNHGKAALEIGRALAAIEDDESRADVVAEILAIIRIHADRLAERAQRDRGAGNRRPGRQAGDSPAGA